MVGSPTLHETSGEVGWGGNSLGSPVTSPSITSRAEELDLLSVPLILLPAGESPDVKPEREPNPEVVPPSVAFSREGQIATPTETVATGDQPQIGIRLSGCPYCITTDRDRDIACIDSLFGVQVHHPRFLECGGPGVGPVAGSSSGRMVSGDGPA